MIAAEHNNVAILEYLYTDQGQNQVNQQNKVRLPLIVCV
jgi:hypothetical protein